MTAPDISLRLAGPEDAADWLRVIREAFSSRRPVDPPADALSDDEASVAQAIREGHGVGAEVGGELVGCLLMDVDGDRVTLRRVSVVPAWSGLGISDALVRGALELAADIGARRAALVAREEFPELVSWWERRGFTRVGRSPHLVHLERDVPLLVTVEDADAMRRLGERLARHLRAGDVIIASGELGAGKTTFTQGIGAGLQISGPVISPTFVISRIHPSTTGGPDLVHVDAYRMADGAELADIDLDSALERSVVLVEWGTGIAEWLGENRLEVRIERESTADEDVRTVLLDGIGARWDGVLHELEER